MDDQFLNNSLYADLRYQDSQNEVSSNYQIISECQLTERMNSFYPLEAQDSKQDVPFESFSDNEKVLIPGKLPGDPPMLVNAKQARRILILRQKKYKKLLQVMDEGTSMSTLSLMKATMTRTRKKDEVRQRVALNRKRVNGLFVNKRKEMLLA